jgi:hypothetical protein
MVDFDLNGFESLVWFYGNREGIITPDTWEKIVCKSVNGTHLPGDTFMADGMKDKSGLNVKSLLKTFTKGNKQTCSFVQCRCPLNEETDNIGEGIIKTLVSKREESFNKFALDKMLDVFIIHNRVGNDYAVRLFVSEQKKYESFDYEWHNGCAYLNPNKNKKTWKNDWELKRIGGNASAFQTCLNVKKVFNLKDCIANFVVKCYDDYDVSIEEAKANYYKSKQPQ